MPFWALSPPAFVPVERTHPLAGGMVGCWPLTEGAGARCHDATRQGGPLFLTGLAEPQRATTYRGDALFFFGSTDTSNAIIVKDNLLMPGPFTIALWTLRSGAGGGNFGRLWSLETSAGAVVCEALWRSTTSKYQFVVNGTSLEINPPFPFDWSFTALTMDDSGGVFVANWSAFSGWVTGTLTTTVPIPTSGQLLLGNRSSDLQRCWEGLIGPAYLWRRTLSFDEIRALKVHPFEMLASPVWRRFAISPPAAGGLPTVARPSDDMLDGSWTNQDDETDDLFDSIDESTAGDADFIKSSESPVVPDIVKLRLQPMADPGVSTGHYLRIRAGKDFPVGDQIDLLVRLYAADGTTEIANRTITDLEDLDDYEFTLTEAEADALQTSDYETGLVIAFEALKP